MSFPGGHDPTIDVCPACGERCVHGDLLISANKKERRTNRAKPSAGPEAIASYDPGKKRGRPRMVDANKVNKWRVVTYLNSGLYSDLLKFSGTRDLSEVLRDIIKERLEKEST